jgi:NAD(P)-dependent dehydrogenase (short-subunit alcohol dehydrogenase family)
MVILITGASRGIGAATAPLLTGSGHTVLLVSRNRRRLEEVAGACNREAGKDLAFTLPFDLSDLPDLEKEFVSRVQALVPRVDGVINNAGQLINKPFEKVRTAEARSLLDINFIVPAQLIRICLPLMEGSALKHVVNISSMGGFQGSSKFPGLAYYSASKAALASLTECLAEELKETGIRINALALGSVQTEMLSEAFPGFRAPLDPEEMGRFFQWFILEGGRYFNGKVLPVSVSTP